MDWNLGRSACLPRGRANRPAIVETLESRQLMDGSSASHFLLAGEIWKEAGMARTITVTARDASGNLASDFSGTINLSTSDPQADLPATAEIRDGVATFDASFKTAGTQSLTAKAEGVNLSGRLGGIRVLSASPSRITLDGPTSVVAGMTERYAVTAHDAFGNVATSPPIDSPILAYESQILVVGIGASPSIFAPDSRVVQDGQGVVDITFPTAGVQSLSAYAYYEANVSTTLVGISVAPAPMSHLVLTTTPQSTLGGPIDFTLTAYDAFGNVATDNNDTIGIATDEYFSMTLEGDILLSNPRQIRLLGGTTFFSIGFATSGTKSIVFTDRDNPASTVTASFSYGTTPGFEPKFSSAFQGVLYRDADANNIRGTGEPGLAGRVLFQDRNQDGILDAGEPTAISDANGRFAFPDLAGNPAVVRVLQSGARVGQVRVLSDGTVTVGLVPEAGGPVDANAAFVRSMYLAVLGRSGSASEVETWLVRIDQGMGRDGVARGFVTSEENRQRQVASYYQQYLHRAPDPVARYWVDALLAGGSETSVRAAILDSSEYRAAHPDDASLVDGLYQDVLGRAGEPSGVAAFRDQLAAGAGTPSIVETFVGSTEAIDRTIDGFYSTYLRRDSDPLAANWRAEPGRAVGSTTGIAVGILSSDEFYREAGKLTT